MSQEKANQPKSQQASYGSWGSYAGGFVLSLALTLGAYLLVRKHVANYHLSPSDTFMVIALPILAVTQLVVQMVFFLHVDRETKPRWNLVVLLFAALIVLIIVIGSLWIMYHLNYNMTPQQQNDYLLKQNGGI